MDMQQRGHRAKEILADPLIVEALDLIEQSLIQTWKESDDSTAREDAWYTLRGHQRFVTTLTNLVWTGEYQNTLEEKYNVKDPK